MILAFLSYFEDDNFSWSLANNRRWSTKNNPAPTLRFQRHILPLQKLEDKWSLDYILTQNLKVGAGGRMEFTCLLHLLLL